MNFNWKNVLIILFIIFFASYVFVPVYKFHETDGKIYRCNKFTGSVKHGDQYSWW